MKHIVSLLVENKPGVLARVVGLISGRGYNIDGLAVAPTQDPDVSKMTIEVPGDDRVIEQVTKQLNKLVDVIKVTDLTVQRYVGQEMAMIKVAVNEEQRSAVIHLVDVFGARVILVQPGSLIVRVVDDQQKISDFLNVLKPYRVLEVNRSGLVAMSID